MSKQGGDPDHERGNDRRQTLASLLAGCGSGRSYPERAGPGQGGGNAYGTHSR